MHNISVDEAESIETAYRKTKTAKSSGIDRMFYSWYQVLNHIMAKEPTASNSEKSQHRTDAVRQKGHKILQGVK